MDIWDGPIAGGVGFEGNTVTGAVKRIMEEYWCKIEIDVVTSPTFLKDAIEYQKAHPEWTNIEQQPDGKWKVDPNEGGAKITLWRGGASQCAPGESACVVMRGRDKTVLEGWLYQCECTCNGIGENAILWDSRRKAAFTDAAFETTLLNIIGKRSTDAECSWTFAGEVEYDSLRAQTCLLVGSGSGFRQLCAKERTMTKKLKKVFGTRVSASVVEAATVRLEPIKSGVPCCRGPRDRPLEEFFAAPLTGVHNLCDNIRV